MRPRAQFLTCDHTVHTHRTHTWQHTASTGHNFPSKAQHCLHNERHNTLQPANTPLRASTPAKACQSNATQPRTHTQAARTATTAHTADSSTPNGSVLRCEAHQRLSPSLACQAQTCTYAIDENKHAVNEIGTLLQPCLYVGRGEECDGPPFIRPHERGGRGKKDGPQC